MIIGQCHYVIEMAGVEMTFRVGPKYIYQENDNTQQNCSFLGE